MGSELNNNQNFNNILFEALPVGLALTRMDGTFVEVNPAFAQILGRTNSEIQKLTYFDITPSDYYDEEMELLQNLKITGQYGPYEKEYIHVDGHRVPVRLQGRIIRHNGEDFIWSSVENISETKLAEREIKRFKATLDETLDCVFMFSAETLRFFYVNEGAVKQIGYDIDELFEMTPFDIKPEISEEEFRTIITPLIDGDLRITTFETIHQHKNGDRIPVEIFLQYFNLENEAPHFIAIVRDITERKLTEKILIQSNLQLEEQVRLRTSEYMQAKDEAENANRAKSQFLSSMSHELRTPLNAILGFSQIIDMSTEDNDTKRHAEEIINAGQHLLSLINDVLDLSKIESGNLDLLIEKCSLNNLLASTIALVHPIADKYSIKIINNVSLPDDVIIYVDINKLKQVVINLLSNGIKYNRKNGSVIVDYHIEEDKSVCISVTDTGLGLNAEHMRHIFEPFNRAGAEDSNIEGTGLGLAISKLLIERMNGQISVKSEKDQGSCFCVHVPIA